MALGDNNTNFSTYLPIIKDYKILYGTLRTLAEIGLALLMILMLLPWNILKEFEKTVGIQRLVHK